MGEANDKLRKAYNDSWVAGLSNSKNCSGFLKTLARVYAFSLPDAKADGILTYLKDSPEWVHLGNGGGGLMAAISAAASGALVVAGASSADYGGSDGHVAILLPKKAGPHNAPLIYGGASNEAARSPGTKTIREVWRPTGHQHLQFYKHPTIQLGHYD